VIVTTGILGLVLLPFRVVQTNANANNNNKALVGNYQVKNRGFCCQE